MLDIQAKEPISEKAKELKAEIGKIIQNYFASGDVTGTESIKILQENLDFAKLAESDA